MTIDDDHQISRFVPDRLPEFVRVEHPTLVAFLEAYYEWLGQRRDSGLVISPMAMHDIPDVDTTLDQFIDNFKAQYLFNFPESLAVNEDTGNPVDERKLIKSIKQFYLAKGTEKSYEFLFRIFYDTNVEFYYPKKDILRLSSGRWIQNNYLRISNVLGDQIYRAAGNLIVQRNSNGAIVATARVVSVNVFQIDNFPVAELLISGRNGTFQTGDLGLEFQDGDQTFNEVRIYSVVSTVNITDSGSNYRIGERIRFVSNTGDGGQGGKGTIAEVDAVGGIRKINIDDFGINYTNPPLIEIETSRGSGFLGTVTVGSLCQSFGYYANNDGRLSTNKVLQDNHYYQNWSYVLKSEIVIDTYRELIRRLVHPVGTGMFGSVLIKRCNRANLDNASALMSFKIPYIGNYVPYTFQTFDDLSVWFQGVTAGGTTAAGYSPSAHDSLIQQEGNGFAVIGNPITNDVGFKEAASGILTTPGFPDADPFWIVYPHPNKHVEHGYHYARVWKTQFDDFVTWREWINNKEPRGERGQRFNEMSRSTFDGNTIGSGAQIQYLVAGDPSQGAGGNQNAGGDDLGGCFIDGLPNGCIGPSNLENPSGGECCCCVAGGDDFGLGVPNCKCEEGAWTPYGSNTWVCTCPYGYERVWVNCGYECVCPAGPGNCPPISPLCPPDCPDNCCIRTLPDGRQETFCRDPQFGCNEACLDPIYAFENCCECYGQGGGPPGQPPCCEGDPCDSENWFECCVDDPCSDRCYDFCFNYPTHPFCLERCYYSPCCQGCEGRECNPACDQYDPCLTSCPNFDYCATGASACPEYGPCHPLCPDFDICTSVGCSGYDPCNIRCNPDYCDGGGECYDDCVCGNRCATGCSGFDWCNCDLGGATCCAENPCIPECNPDPCDSDGPCYNPCDPSCPGFDPCSTNCPGYGPCHPDCPEVPGDITRRPCNPLCPGFDRCNRDCPNYDRDFCCQGCNCGDGGGIGDPVYRDIDNDIRRWRRDNPPFNPNDNNPCNNDNARCLFGQNTFDPNAHLGALLKYDESSEFRKITMRAFFNMPAGEAFDCREERVSFVALPQFLMIQPTSGQEIKTEDPNRPLTIQYRIANAENLGYYKVAQVNIYIDNRLRSTVSINAREVSLANIENGRRTLKMEMVDFEGNNVPGTQTVVIFGYRYEGSESFQTMQSSAVGGGLQITPAQSGSRVLSPNLGTTQSDRRLAWELSVCLAQWAERAIELWASMKLVYSCLHSLCDDSNGPCPGNPWEGGTPNPFELVGMQLCHQDLCNRLRNVYECVDSNWTFNCTDPIPGHLGGSPGGGIFEGLGSSTGDPFVGRVFELFWGASQNLAMEQSCKIWQCLGVMRQQFAPVACVSLEPLCYNSVTGEPYYTCIQELTRQGKNPFCADPSQDEEFNRNMFRMRYECPAWRFEYPGWYDEVIEQDGQLIPTGRGWYGTAEDGPPSDGTDGGIDRGDRTKRNLTPDEWRRIFETTPCGSCQITEQDTDCNIYTNPETEALQSYFACINRAVLDARNSRRAWNARPWQQGNDGFGREQDTPMTNSERNRLISTFNSCCERLLTPIATDRSACSKLNECMINLPENANLFDAQRYLLRCLTGQ